MDKKNSRLRRARRARAKIKELVVHRLCVYRTPRHIYVQLIAPNGAEVVASASTLDKTLREAIPFGGNISAAQIVGKAVAERARAKGVERAAFDRAGFKYHGRIKALADAARGHGLQV
ncbi:MAG: 50S ribosomal protein L18 [Pseudomonadota bacterium]|nr:50S ribosomal protein L18 [Gammaproteobacteria bacterium]MDQ3581307.1 50S ribosomal protein L18 [Pseudomonadota bacterium]